VNEPERRRGLKELQAYIDELVGQGAYAPDVIQDEEWITLTRRRLIQLLQQVRQDAKSEWDIPRDEDKQPPIQ